MTEIDYLREQSRRAERLSKNVLDVLTVKRLMEAVQEYRSKADQLEVLSASINDQQTRSSR